MKKSLYICLFIYTLIMGLFWLNTAKAQIRIIGPKFIIAGGSSGGGGTTVAVDTAAEKLTFAPVMNQDFDATRPNQQVTVTDNISFNENDVLAGRSGYVYFIMTGNFTISLNGGTIITTSTSFVKHYTNSGGSVSWY